ncbi:MAG: rhodanese-like domain-containing protein, partial [Elusimicrobiota bacterium]|nr:rhodanese-like domain-containing protein [Elusimicrobiota bacterium]
VYDAGIAAWVKAYPDKTTLMGNSPAPLFMLLSKKDLEKKSLSFDEFKKKAQDPDAVVVDAREPIQRKEIPEFAGIKNIPSDELVSTIKKGEFKDKQLLIFDAVGKQVEWIQYYLEAEGYTRYHFLAKGVAGAKPSPAKP